MACWISIPKGVIPGVGVTVEGLRVSLVGHQGIGRGEPADRTHIIPGIHVNQPQVVAAAVVHLVAGEAAFRQEGRVAAPEAAKELALSLPKGQEAGHVQQRPAAGGHRANAAEMVAVQVNQRVVAAGAAGDAQVVKADIALVGTPGHKTAHR